LKTTLFSHVISRRQNGWNKKITDFHVQTTSCELSHQASNAIFNIVNFHTKLQMLLSVRSISNCTEAELLCRCRHWINTPMKKMEISKNIKSEMLHMLENVILTDRWVWFYAETRSQNQNASAGASANTETTRTWGPVCLEKLRITRKYSFKRTNKIIQELHWYTYMQISLFQA
jgi:hypothetical protein